ncbi:MAG: hypothetical protein Q9164_005219, partial [Protoblastenia rupestris]
MSTAPPSKRQKTDAPYELIYWPSIPGRGEHIRLCLEATKTAYTDVSNHTPAGASAVLDLISAKNLGDASNPPPLAPPILRHGDLLLAQLPNILLYLGPRLGLAGPKDNETAIYHINQLALTALDGLSNEVHDIHHPISTAAVYEEQKEEAMAKARDWLGKRLPKFLGYFEKVLQGEGSRGGEWLYGGKLTYADLVLWQCLDGVGYAFPKKMAKVKEEGKFGKVFALCERVGELEAINEYLGSERRLKYGMGIYRHYPELDSE